ncbi:MAG: nucleoside/nucleotide kinase family protein [Methylobacterium sp. SCN 67-24]|mgnify:FL=1|nr:MAG: nucleoside/nucleotide kinase family protein [Methylobacterium sp. SCN 67-24]
MSEIARIAALIAGRAEGSGRILVALAGPPAAGKSEIAGRLAQLLPETAVVPMDGFHFDNAVLAELGLLQRKGAPETFDYEGLETCLRRLRSGEAAVAVPLFDRALELARAGAALVPARTRIVLVEGNYLLLDRAPWNRLAPLFDLTIFLAVPLEELERRLLARWAGHGRAPEAARAWVEENDLPNARLVQDASRPADIVWANTGPLA